MGAIVTREQIEQIASIVCPPQPPQAISSDGSRRNGEFDVAHWLAKHGIGVTRHQRWKDGERWILQECPFDRAHNGTSVAVVRLASGALQFKCQHETCVGRKWRDLRKLKEPEYKSVRFADAKSRRKKASTEQGEAPTAPQIAALIQIDANENFAQDPGGKLFYFRDGIYRPRGEDHIRAAVKKIVAPEYWSKHLANEVVEYLRVDSPETLGAAAARCNLRAQRPAERPHARVETALVRVHVVRPTADRLRSRSDVRGLGKTDQGDFPARCRG
jgi:hypothetical protein